MDEGFTFAETGDATNEPFVVARAVEVTGIEHIWNDR